jgi:hypothetical protein
MHSEVEPIKRGAMRGQSEPESVRAIRIEAISLQISVSETYILLARSTKDALQSQVFKRRALDAYHEAVALMTLLELPEPQASTFKSKLQALDPRLQRLGAHEGEAEQIDVER